MKSTRTRAKNDVIGCRRSEPIILSDFLPQFYQGRVCKYASGNSSSEHMCFVVSPWEEHGRSCISRSTDNTTNGYERSSVSARNFPNLFNTLLSNYFCFGLYTVVVPVSSKFHILLPSEYPGNRFNSSFKLSENIITLFLLKDIARERLQHSGCRMEI
ncbi:hypothetical protein AVEN_275451-1 [Araneus ventricosus]|uniref:Uncharacterized protein n=1 Tax=Araneus ventricosus TaxID=182803 RepID=A0A4Y2UCL4_ARAVE|nr:hypothetical protein AVEN_111396-1 [Araneus ventricosus]GBO09311.1 hypothetical protein AVEN_275451-1 [Araneus ventricosus]